MPPTLPPLNCECLNQIRTTSNSDARRCIQIGAQFYFQASFVIVYTDMRPDGCLALRYRSHYALTRGQNEVVPLFRGATVIDQTSPVCELSPANEVVCFETLTPGSMRSITVIYVVPLQFANVAMSNALISASDNGTICSGAITFEPMVISSC